MTRRSGTFVAALSTLLFATSVAHAASVLVGVNDGALVDPVAEGPVSVMTGDEVGVFLALEPGEVASVLEATFAAVGGAASFRAPGNDVWNFGCFGNTVGFDSLVSCTSTNAGGERLAGLFTVSDAEAFTLTLAAIDVFNDIDEPPFVGDVTVSTPIGTLLVPEVGTLLLMASGLLGLGVASRRR